jgi:hypothetical protein
MDILHQKMVKDLVKMSFEYASQGETPKQIDELWLQSRIQVHMKEHKMSFPELGMSARNPKYNPDTRCCARLWKNQTGKDQCTHARVGEDGYYCEKHVRMLTLDGVLRFGDIRETKPTHDLIKLNKGIHEELHWIEPNPLQQLQQVLDQQSRKVILTTPGLLVN